MFWLELLAAMALTLAALATGTRAMAMDGLDAALGKALFDRQWVAAPASTDTADGLGPLFNARSCTACHQGGTGARFPAGKDGRAPDGLVVRLTDGNGAPHPVLGRQLQTHAIAGFAAEGRTTWQNGGVRVTLAEPSQAVRQEVRQAPGLRAMQMIEQVDEDAILRTADPDDANGDGISGRVRKVGDGKGGTAAGRFGLKASHATLDTQIADAFAFDLGLSSLSEPRPSGDCTAAQAKCLRAPSGVSAATENQELSRQMIALTADYLRTLRPQRAAAPPPALFISTGCAACHAPALPARGGQTATLYSDLLLHDLGAQDGGVVKEADAETSEWRTAPLVDLAADGGRRRFMHDGAAATLEDAIARHGGEAESSATAFRALNRKDKDALLQFLSSL
ncbi:di-heme oxidoredictase family protein [Aestuariivirga sp.]|uniref:di-heme oxidoredictase family protein n=1 Tax=Aestuariivirga sp. TaxID=2650926 RepID=UPI0039E21CBB